MEKILIICVDRDNDIGEKLRIRGPIIGRERNLKVANQLVLKDPEESDANCLFGAIKEYDELKKKGKNVEIVTLLGDKEVGLESDMKIERQLKYVLEKIKPNKGILVSDGAEDEFILPVLQSYLPIVSVSRIIVKQSKSLESSYYFLVKYFRELLANPEVRKLFYGIPAIVLLLYALFGDLGWRLILGFLGIYFFIKGFGLEKLISSFTSELYSSLQTGKMGFFCYIIGISFLIISVIEGQGNFMLYFAQNFILALLYFLDKALNYILIAVVFFILGKFITDYSKGKKSPRIITALSLTFSVFIVLRTSLDYLFVSGYSIAWVFFSVIIGFIVLFFALSVEKVAE